MKVGRTSTYEISEKIYKPFIAKTFGQEKVLKLKMYLMLDKGHYSRYPSRI